MNVCLLDIDSKIPNLALMRASTWHKLRGDTVKLGYDPLLDHPDICYASKIFTFTDEPEYLPECNTYKGGPGYDLESKMPFEQYDKIMPDYSLYPNYEYAIGRFTRGCPNKCPWCVVPKMDGANLKHVADLKDFWNGQKIVRLLDDNIMADSDEFVNDCKQLHDAGVKVIWEALDVRYVNNDTAKALGSLKFAKPIHFAWDGPAQDRFIHSSIETLKRNGIKPWRLMFYVLVGYNTSPEYDMYRIQTLYDLGVDPFVMPFDKTNPYQKHLARWCNNKFIFKSCSFEEYGPYLKWRENNGKHEFAAESDR